MQALLLIDLEQGFLENDRPPRNNLNAEKNIASLLELFRKQNKPVIHIQHVSIDTQSVFSKPSGYAFMSGFEPLADEVVFQKHVNSAFIGTNLEQYLKEQGIHQLIMVGFTLPHCVSTTARMAGNLGFDTTVISDATVSYALTDVDGKFLEADCIHHCHLAALNEEFAKIMTTQQYTDKEK